MICIPPSVARENLTACVKSVIATRSRVVAVAREWIGTPFLAGECLKGRGCDCGSLLAGVFAEAGVIQPLPLGKYDHLAPCMKGDAFYLARIASLADEVHESRAQPGDIVVYRIGRAYSHAALIVHWPESVIHADGRRGVTAAHGSTGRLGGRERLFFRMRGVE